MRLWYRAIHTNEIFMAVLVVVHVVAIHQDLDLDDKHSVRICMLFNFKGSYSAVHSTVEEGGSVVSGTQYSR